MEKSKYCSSSLKNDKQSPANYRPISLLPICGKIFERLLYDEKFNFFITNHLISTNQLGFKPGDSCTNQLLSITHEIYALFDEGYQVWGVFLDISKVFDKVWHVGLIWNIWKIVMSHKRLLNRKERAVLNEQCSPWMDVQTGVPEGFILGPFLFLNLY